MVNINWWRLVTFTFAAWVYKINSVQTSFLVWNGLIFKIIIHLDKYDGVLHGIVKKWLSVINYYNKETGLLHKTLILVYFSKCNQILVLNWKHHSHTCLTHIPLVLDLLAEINEVIFIDRSLTKVSIFMLCLLETVQLLTEETNKYYQQYSEKTEWKTFWAIWCDCTKNLLLFRHSYRDA